VAAGEVVAAEGEEEDSVVVDSAGEEDSEAEGEEEGVEEEVAAALQEFVPFRCAKSDGYKIYFKNAIGL